MQSRIGMMLSSILLTAGSNIDEMASLRPKTKASSTYNKSKNTAFTKGKKHKSLLSRSRRRK